MSASGRIHGFQGRLPRHGHLDSTGARLGDDTQQEWTSGARDAGLTAPGFEILESAGAMRGNEPPSEEDRVNDDENRRVFEIAEEYLEGLAAGEFLDREAIVAAHPDLAEPLRRRLLLIEIIWRAGQ